LALALPTDSEYQQFKADDARAVEFTIGTTAGGGNQDCARGSFVAHIFDQRRV
jgi:hypothetical protein